MGRIVYIDLSNKKIVEKENDVKDYGRALITKLINENISLQEEKFHEENVVVLAPGLFSGTLAPSTGRLLVGTKKSANGDILLSNLSGTISQKLASINIEAIVLSGRNMDDTPVSIVLDKDNILFEYIENVKGLCISPYIEKVRRLYGKDCGIIGIGPSGENMLPISSIFSTYPEGTPAFYCARNSFGDVFGFKNLKGIVVNSKSYFNAPVYDKDKFGIASKELSKIILEHPICGTALPGLGSITLLKLMKEGKLIEIKDISIKEKTNSTDYNINRTCSPLCVVGCLNKHANSGDECYSAPVESEARAALFEAFGISDNKYVKNFTKECFELGIDCMEFIFTCEMYFEMEHIKGDIEQLDKAIKDIRDMTLIGRVLASKTHGVYNLYKDKTDSKKMVSKPSVVEEKEFNIHIPSKPDYMKDMPDLEYLYAYVIVLENLGFCLFTSFAFLDSNEALTLLTEMFYYKTGNKIDEKGLLEYAINSLNNEKKIPNFIKVLYRYFNMTK